MSLRQPDFAGSWYPSSERECLRAFAEFETTCQERSRVQQPRGGIVPHAGWVFSGRLAYNVIRELARGSEPPDTVLLFGGHLRPTSPISLLTKGEFWTPLGTIAVDEELASALLARLPELVPEEPEGHRPDNTVELQAPLLKHFFPAARLLVVGAPPRPETLELADLLASLAGERRLLAVGSTDLTHYGPNYGWAPRGLGPGAEAWVREENDRRFLELSLALQAAEMIGEGLASSNACCPGAAAAAARFARQRGSQQGELLAYATSCEVRRDDSFVGYGAVLF